MIILNPLLIKILHHVVFVFYYESLVTVYISESSSRHSCNLDINTFGTLKTCPFQSLTLPGRRSTLPISPVVTPLETPEKTSKILATLDTYQVLEEGLNLETVLETLILLSHPPLLDHGTPSKEYRLLRDGVDIMNDVTPPLQSIS